MIAFSELILIETQKKYKEKIYKPKYENQTTKPSSIQAFKENKYTFTGP